MLDKETSTSNIPEIEDMDEFNFDDFSYDFTKTKFNNDDPPLNSKKRHSTSPPSQKQSICFKNPKSITK